MLTAITDIVLAWIEILNVADSECKTAINVSFLYTRFLFFLLSRFYLMSLWNIEALSIKPYKSRLVSF